ncbi:MAG: Calx-beta domain-containing protein [Pyrinomonadaceae bacterium]
MKSLSARIRPRVSLATFGLIVVIALPVVFIEVAASVEKIDLSRSPVVFDQENPASLDRWSSNGPEGGIVLSLAIDRSNPAIIYAGTPTGVFKSTNRGESWSASLTANYVSIVEVAPTTPTTIFAASNKGIYKSTDAGATWNAVNNGLETQEGPIFITALAIDPTNSDIIYVAGPDIEVGGAFKAIYKTTNGGASWSITKHSINPNAYHHSLAIDAANPNIIYAAGNIGASGTVWKSPDNGRFWYLFELGFDARYIVYTLTIDPTNTNVIYVGTEALGVYKSTDGGLNWTAFSDGLPYYAIGPNGQRSFYRVNSIKVDPLNPSIVYAGTYAGVSRSTNGGSWNTLLSGTNLSVNSLAIDSADTTIIYAGTDGGMLKNSGGGAGWSTINQGLRGVSAFSLRLNTENGNIYALTDRGIFGRADNSGDWVGRDFYPLAFDLHNPNTIYAWRYGLDGVFKSTNSGATWSSANTGLENNYVSALAIDPGNSAIIYAGTDAGLFKSTNGGETWTPRGNLYYATLLTIDPHNSTIIYALAYDSDDSFTVFKSIDSGNTWNRSDGNVTTHFCYVNAMVLDPLNPATLYLSGYGNASPEAVRIFKSTDGGGSWSIASAGLPSSEISSLAIDPHHANNLYAGTFSDGVFRSTDGGASWNPLNQGLTSLMIYALAMDTSGNFLHAGTQAGVFDIQFTATGGPASVQFSFASYVVGEGSPQVDITISRSGDTTNAASVRFTTNDSAGLQNCNVFNGVASSRCDYTTDVGTLHFAAGQNSKTISIPIVDDSFAEGSENFTITLSNASGATLGSPTSTTVTINDNETSNGPNPVDGTPFFVRQQYLDFLNREPDPGGHAAWQAVINGCAQGDTSCNRIHVSSSFFRSPEFQGRGYFVYRFYPVSLGRKPDYDEFTPDIAKVSGFLSDAELEAAKGAFIAEFMSRPAFVTTYNGLNDTQYVDTLLTTAGVTSPNRDFWIAALGNGTRTRATVLRDISESSEVYNKYFNQAFVVMQYFGYLRRQPDALYLSWIAHLEATSDYRSMINGFMNSLEYRGRFGP